MISKQFRETFKTEDPWMCAPHGQFECFRSDVRLNVAKHNEAEHGGPTTHIYKTLPPCICQATVLPNAVNRSPALTRLWQREGEGKQKKQGKQAKLKL